MKCPACKGSGRVATGVRPGDVSCEPAYETCSYCKGTGKLPDEARRYGDDPPPPPGQVTEAMATQAVAALRSNVMATTENYIGMASNLSIYSADLVAYQQQSGVALAIMSQADYATYKDSLGMSAGLVNNQIRATMALATLSTTLARLTVSQAEMSLANGDFVTAYNTAITGDGNRIEANDEIAAINAYMVTVLVCNNTARSLLMANGITLP